jgi:beta-1,4-mannosyltransferase
MSKIYMYPKNDYATLESPNPYVLNLEASLSEKHIIVNQNPNTKGVIELFNYIFRADIFFFNWIEDVSLKRYGKLQSILFILFLVAVKALNKKIIWVLHNKYSHEKSNKRWTKFGFELMIKHSDLILTHSNSGVEFVKEQFPRYIKKVKYIIHPIEEMLAVKSNVEKKYDILIWGTIHKYKGVIDFLKFAKDFPDLKNVKIMISGVCPDLEEKKQLDKLMTDNIHHINDFQKIEDIAELANQSRFVLFTYNSESILSSGSLMDSLRMGANVIGPNKGAFRDLKSFQFIKTFDTFDEISFIIEKNESINNLHMLDLENFCHQNSWKLFGNKLFEVAEGLL